jgi:predicted metal-dependent phosphoesterase TrpH
MLKVELHAHTSDDPEDFIPHTSRELIDRAAQLGYGALAITLHSRQLVSPEIEAYARDRGLTLIPGVEVAIEGRHVLLLNYPAAARADEVTSFDDLARLRAGASGLVVAPHAFYPTSTCLGRDLLDRHADLFDAVEVSGFYTRWLDFNREARDWAQSHGKPLVGNGDVHRLSMLGTTFSLVDAEPHPDAICEAVRSGRVEVSTRPLRATSALRQAGQLAYGDLRKLINRMRRRRAGLPAYHP